ncbi:hypothetical protein, partial [Lysobacter sp. 1R34A]|uniref:hypothetical protein n=1 Tax=Lysobacter sp. 1R34A TaxID=3445786 RepID=UPI003EE9C099
MKRFGPAARSSSRLALCALSLAILSACGGGGGGGEAVRPTPPPANPPPTTPPAPNPAQPAIDA